MKKLIIIAMMLGAITMQAQVRLNVGKESKAISADALEKGTHVGNYEDCDVWLNQVRKGWRITAMNHDLEIAKTAEMELVADRLLAATMSGNTATMLLSKQDKKDTYILVARLSIDGEASVDTLATLNTPGRKDKCQLWAAKSNLGNYMGVVAVQEFRDSMEYVTTAFLVASRGNLVFRREFAMTSFDQIFVTDNGSIATLATENTAAGVDVMVNYVSANVVSTGKSTIDSDPVNDARIVNVLGNRVLALGTTYERGRRADQTACNGVIGISYDIDSAKVYGYSTRLFDMEDYNVLYNLYLKKKQKNTLVHNISVMGCVPLNYGGAIVLSRSFKELKSTNDGVTHHIFQHLGLHVAAVNTEGQLAWTVNIRCNDRQENSGTDLRLGVSSEDDIVNIYKNESRKEPVGYDIFRAAKPMNAGSKSNLVRYAIFKSGDVEKAILESKTKHAFLLVTDDQEVFTVRGRKVRRATVTLTPEAEVE